MTELHYGAVYWKTFNTGESEWKQLSQSLSTKVLIIGGGMSGLLTAFALYKHNIDFVLVEADDIAEGSSLASTGLLQFSNDIMLHELQQQIGADKANYYYRSCYNALQQLKQVAAEIEPIVGEVQCYPRSSMQFSSIAADVDKLKQEYEALSGCGLPCELWTQQQIEAKFPFSKQCALITRDDAEINPHLFVLKLAQFLSRQGAQLYERSPVSSYKKLDNGLYQAAVNEHYIEAQYMIHAVGYQFEQLQQLQLQLLLNRSYVIVTEPIGIENHWYENMLLWETARPYLYMRKTADNRIMLGGLDEPTHIVNHDPDSIRKHSDTLLNMLHQLLPNVQTSVAYQWNATFLTTRDGLPYIGAHPQDDHQLYVLGYGGNGTVSSMIGAQWAADKISGSQELDKLTGILALSR